MRLTRFVFSGLFFVLSCNSADDTRPPLVDNVPNGGDSGAETEALSSTTENTENSSNASSVTEVTAPSATDPSATSVSSGDAGTATDSADGSDSAEPLLDGGSSDGNGDASVPDPFPCPSDDAEPPADGFNAVCDPNAEWGTETAVSISSSEFDQLIAITPDELTLTWYAAIGAAGNYLVADRESASADFEAPQAVYDVVVTALSADGLRLLGLSPDGSALLELERSARGDAFSAGSSEAYEEVNSQAAAEGELFRSALLSADDLALYYSVQGTADSALLKVSQRGNVDEPWPAGDVVESCELGGQGPLVRQPTGIAADGLTLFYYDAARSLSRGAWRAAANEPFVYFADLGQRRAVQANGECNRLYYSVVGETTQIVFAERR